MKTPQLLDLYSDYLLSSFTLTTAVGLSELVDRGYSHDQISRFLGQEKLLPKDFWKMVKSLIRKVENDYGIVAIDDTIEQKPYTKENAIVCWHWDHSKNCNVKGINVLNFLYCSNSVDSEDANLPLAYEIIRKTQEYYDAKTDKVKRRSDVGKNELVRERLRVLVQLNRVKFRYVTWDTWFSSKQNLEFVRDVLKKEFVVALKDNRTFSFSLEQKRKGEFFKISEHWFVPNRLYKVWLKGMDFPVHLVKQVFTNKDGSSGVAYLITSDLSLAPKEIVAIYQKRWNIEVFHKSLKQNASLEKSPTKNETTQSNHIFASMIAYCKLEVLKFRKHMNHFQLKSTLYIKAVKAAFKELQELKQKQKETAQIQQPQILAIA